MKRDHRKRTGAAGERSEQSEERSEQSKGRAGSAERLERVRTVRTDGDRVVSYAEYGAPDGTPCLFLHGTPGSRLLGRLFHEEAKRRGVRLLAPDRPGYGRSMPWPERTLADTGKFVSAVLDGAGISRARIVGFSGGGPHALALAATRGDLVDAVDVVSGPPPRSTLLEMPRMQKLLGALARRSPSLLGAAFRSQAWIAGRTSSNIVVSRYATEDVDAIDDRVADLVERDFVEAFARTASGAVIESRLLVREWDVSLEGIDCRTRLWHGERDANVPVDGVRRLGERLPDARVIAFDDADHLTTLLRSRRPILAGDPPPGDGG